MALRSYLISSVLLCHRVQPAPRHADASICTNAAFAGNRHSTDLCPRLTALPRKCFVYTGSRCVRYRSVKATGRQDPAYNFCYRRRDHIVWLLLLVIGQNWYGEFSPGEPWVLDALIDAAYASIGSLVILSIALLLRNHDRFLPRYAFHIFYPGHLAVLAVLGKLSAAS